MDRALDRYVAHLQTSLRQLDQMLQQAGQQQHVLEQQLEDLQQEVAKQRKRIEE